MDSPEQRAYQLFLKEHREVTRRFFMQLGGLGFAASSIHFGLAHAQPEPAKPAAPSKPEKAGAASDPYFTPASHFRDVSRGNPIPHTLSEERLAAVGLTRETWSLEVISDPEHPAKIGKPLTREQDSAFTFENLMQLAEERSVRFAKVMTCLNLGCPLGMGLWEGVPLRDVIWLTKPREDIRRVFYYGFHNDDPKQIFRSSLPLGRVLEDPIGLPPVILCYRLNGEWLDSERGGPVRMLVPEAYGFKSVKWLTHVVLTNLAFANDTYAEKNNDIDSPMKTFAATLSIPRTVKANEPVAVSGYAQVGVSGLSKVQVSIESSQTEQADDDPYFTRLSWSDAEILPAPTEWNSQSQGRIPDKTFGFDKHGKPNSWPMVLTNAHWATVLPGLAPGKYTFRCRTVDAQGYAQPLPRPFRKSGHAAIESVALTVTP